MNLALSTTGAVAEATSSAVRTWGWLSEAASLAASEDDEDAGAAVAFALRGGRSLH